MLTGDGGVFGWERGVDVRDEGGLAQGLSRTVNGDEVRCLSQNTRRLTELQAIQ
jgi:hypothetical protein